MTTMHIDSDELYPYYFESKPGPWSKAMDASEAEAAFIRETEARFRYIQSLMESRTAAKQGFLAEQQAEELEQARQQLIVLGITPPDAGDHQEVTS